MGAVTAMESIIAVDVGSTFTHACLLDRVEGVYRLVASVEVPTTLGGPHDDLSIGVQQALAEMEQIVQRRLLDDAQEVILPE
ncbi:MAG: glutamate mutase L, partial [Chloroflexi bacterium]|nr:glutamate mutase L [Chloroflexota bacterium]